MSDSTQRFIDAIAGLTFADCFNPYRDRCEVNDLKAAPQYRLQMLRAIVEQAAAQGVDAFWVGRDLGYRGGRRTGLALTDDVRAHVYTSRWGVPFKPATKGPLVAERTASLVWSVLDRLDRRIFLWNVFPLHPHLPDDPFSNRNHNAREGRMGQELLAEAISLLRPTMVVAVGRDAADALGCLMKPDQVIPVRHPSYGGQSLFLAQMSKLYSLTG